MLQRLGIGRGQQRVVAADRQEEPELGPRPRLASRPIFWLAPAGRRASRGLVLRAARGCSPPTGRRHRGRSGPAPPSPRWRRASAPGRRSAAAPSAAAAPQRLGEAARGAASGCGMKSTPRAASRRRTRASVSWRCVVAVLCAPTWMRHCRTGDRLRGRVPVPPHIASMPVHIHPARSECSRGVPRRLP